LKGRRQKRSEVAAQFQTSFASLYLWQKQEKEEGRSAAKPHSGGGRTKEAVENAPTAVIEEIMAAGARGRFHSCGYPAPPYRSENRSRV
jgi:transposase